MADVCQITQEVYSKWWKQVFWSNESKFELSWPINCYQYVCGGGQERPWMSGRGSVIVRATMDPVVLGIVPKLIDLWTQKNNVTLFFHVCLNTFQKFPFFETERILCILPKDAAGVIEPPTHSTSWDSVETFVGCSIDTFSRREEEEKNCL